MCRGRLAQLSNSSFWKCVVQIWPKTPTNAHRLQKHLWLNFYAGVLWASWSKHTTTGVMSGSLKLQCISKSYYHHYYQQYQYDCPLTSHRTTTQHHNNSTSSTYPESPEMITAKEELLLEEHSARITFIHVKKLDDFIICWPIGKKTTANWQYNTIAHYAFISHKNHDRSWLWPMMMMVMMMKRKFV